MDRQYAHLGVNPSDYGAVDYAPLQQQMVVSTGGNRVRRRAPLCLYNPGGVACSALHSPALLPSMRPYPIHSTAWGLASRWWGLPSCLSRACPPPCLPTHGPQRPTPAILLLVSDALFGGGRSPGARGACKHTLDQAGRSLSPRMPFPVLTTHLPPSLL